MVSVKAECLAAWQTLLAAAQVPSQELGVVADHAKLRIEADGQSVLAVGVDALHSIFEQALPRRLEVA